MIRKQTKVRVGGGLPNSSNCAAGPSLRVSGLSIDAPRRSRTAKQQGGAQSSTITTRTSPTREKTSQKKDTLSDKKIENTRFKTRLNKMLIF